MTVDPPRAQPLPLNTVAGMFVECDARAPGNVMLNLERVLYIESDAGGLAVCRFEGGYQLMLNNTYQEVRDAITAAQP